MAAEAGLRGSFWPSRTQKHLLRAALLDGPNAIAAWREVRSILDLDSLTNASLRLLPLVYTNLSRFGVRDAEMTRLKGLYKKTWFENQLAFHRLRIILQSLQDSGISATVLKGAALTEIYYRDRGARSMHDMDVLVPPDRWREAAEILKQLDWHFTPNNFSDPPRFMHGLEFKHRDGYRLDLHWHVIEYFLRANRKLVGADTSPRVLTAEVAGVSTHVLDHPDQLMHICLHGARPTPGGNVHWVADAMKILHRVSRLDWDRVVRMATTFRCSRAMGEALAYLSDELGASVPHVTLESLRAARISGREALGYAITSRPPRGPRLLRQLEGTVGPYLRLTAAWDAVDALRGLPRFLQEYWNLDGPGRVPATALSRVFRPRPGIPPQ